LLAQIAQTLGQPDKARLALAAAERAYRSGGRPYGLANTLNAAAELELMAGDHAAALALFSRATVLLRAMGPEFSLVAEINTATTLVLAGRHLEARGALEELLVRTTAGKQQGAEAVLHLALQVVAARDGAWLVFDHHAAAAEDLLETTGMVAMDCVRLSECAVHAAAQAQQHQRARRARAVVTSQQSRMR
jgi:tetratricopeptide (TPR) repeat protein